MQAFERLLKGSIFAVLWADFMLRVDTWFSYHIWNWSVWRTLKVENAGEMSVGGLFHSVRFIFLYWRTPELVWSLILKFSLCIRRLHTVCLILADITVSKNTSAPLLWSTEAERSHSLSQHHAASSKKPAFNLSAFGSPSPVSTAQS